MTISFLSRKMELSNLLIPYFPRDVSGFVGSFYGPKYDFWQADEIAECGDYFGVRRVLKEYAQKKKKKNSCCRVEKCIFFGRNDKSFITCSYPYIKMYKVMYTSPYPCLQNLLVGRLPFVSMFRYVCQKKNDEKVALLSSLLINRPPSVDRTTKWLIRGGAKLCFTVNKRHNLMGNLEELFFRICCEHGYFSVARKISDSFLKRKLLPQPSRQRNLSGQIIETEITDPEIKRKFIDSVFPISIQFGNLPLMKHILHLTKGQYRMRSLIHRAILNKDPKVFAFVEQEWGTIVTNYAFFYACCAGKLKLAKRIKSRLTQNANQDIHLGRPAKNEGNIEVLDYLIDLIAKSGNSPTRKRYLFERGFMAACIAGCVQNITFFLKKGIFFEEGVREAFKAGQHKLVLLFQERKLINFKDPVIQDIMKKRREIYKKNQTPCNELGF